MAPSPNMMSSEIPPSPVVVPGQIEEVVKDSEEDGIKLKKDEKSSLGSSEREEEHKEDQVQQERESERQEDVHQDQPVQLQNGETEHKLEPHKSQAILNISEEKLEKDQTVEDKPAEEKLEKDRTVEDKPAEENLEKDKTVEDKPAEEKSEQGPQVIITLPDDSAEDSNQVFLNPSAQLLKEENPEMIGIQSLRLENCGFKNQTLETLGSSHIISIFSTLSSHQTSLLLLSSRPPRLDTTKRLPPTKQDHPPRSGRDRSPSQGLPRPSGSIPTRQLERDAYLTADSER
jgi:hypothetical protein